MQYGELMRIYSKVVLLIIGIVLLAGFASAVSFNFTASDRIGDVTNADFDITKFGAIDHGDTVTFWMEVRGKINTHPDAGYINGYEISIEDISMVGMWMNTGGNTVSIVYLETDNGQSTLSPGEYEINGNKLSFTIQKSLLNDIGSDYTVDVYTAHITGSSPTIATHLDEAYYSPSSGGGNASGGYNGSEGITGMALWGLSVAVCLGISVVWLVIWILIAYWAYKDAQRRGMDSPIVAFLLVFFLNILGLIIYIVIRPKENRPQYQLPPPPPPEQPPQ